MILQAWHQWLRGGALVLALGLGQLLAAGEPATPLSGLRAQPDGQFSATLERVKLADLVADLQARTGIAVTLPAGLQGEISLSVADADAVGLLSAAVRQLLPDAKLATRYQIRPADGRRVVSAVSFFAARSPVAAAVAVPDERAVALAQRGWDFLGEAPVVADKQEWIVPTGARWLQVDPQQLGAILAQAPLAGTAAAAEAQPILELPTPAGGVRAFRIQEAPIMEPELQARFPELRTFKGVAVDAPQIHTRFDLTPAGFHAQVMGDGATYFVDPAYRGDAVLHTVYQAAQLPRQFDDAFCGVQTELDPLAGAPGTHDAVVADGKLRTYRLAVAATGEYTAFHGSAASALSAITTTINRVNQIYEAELAVTFVLVNNNNLIIYTNANTDPYSNQASDTSLQQNQANLDAVIGTGNYDIGHLFCTGPGGLAQLSSACRSATKAQGASGSSFPLGDSFNVRVVCHELGHQFGAHHSFNSIQGSCGNGNRSASSAYEPGSGSTIMGYAGLCDEDNLQFSPDTFFHHHSLEQMLTYLVGNGNCATITVSGNTSPTVNAGNDFSVPYLTPFRLTATGSDPDGDTVTYSWEQHDLGDPATLAAVDNGNIPLFRSYKPEVSPTRSLPRESLLANDLVFGEQLPSVNRTLNFRVTARDNRGGSSGDDMRVTVVTSGQPFSVLGVTNPSSWTVGSTQTVTWQRGNTNNAPFNVSNVRIKLSLDGGLSFPVVLAESTANDGSQTITVPGVSTTNGRVMVESSDTRLFDIFTEAVVIAPTLEFKSVAVDDSRGNGNNNNIANSGESPLDLTITLKNTSGATLNNINATLSSTLATCTVSVAGSTYPSLANGATGINNRVFTVALSQNHPCQQPVPMLLTVTHSGGTTLLSFNLEVGDCDVTPPTVTINQAPGQSDPAGVLPVNFKVTFNEAVTGFASSDVVLSGTALPNAVTISGSGKDYTVSVISLTTNGTIIASIAAGAAFDAAGNPSAASTSSDNTVTYNDAAPPSVVISRAAGQTSPTSVLPVVFVASFSEPVADFIASDLVFSGSAGGSGVSLTGTGSTYTITVGQVAANGLVEVQIPAGAARDLVGNLSQASTGLGGDGHQVLFDSGASLSFAAATSATANEDTQSFPVTVTLASTGGPLATAVTVQVHDLGTGTASTGTDYATLVPTTLTFPAGSVAGASQTVQVSIFEDFVAEGNETVVLGLLNATGPISLGPHTQHALTITEDDFPGIALLPSFMAVDEGQTAEYSVLLRSQPAADIVVTIAPSPISDPDISVNPTTLTFTPANWNLPQAVLVTVALDDDQVNGTGLLIHSAPGLPNATLTVREQDADEVLPAIRLHAGTNTVAEDSEALLVMVSREVGDGDPLVVFLTSSAPHRLQVPASIRFEAGDRQLSFVATIIDTPFAEGPETVIISATGLRHADAALPILVEDDDVAELGLVVTPDAVRESGPLATAHLSRTTDPTLPLTVDLAVNLPGVIELPATVTFAVGQTELSLPLPVINDKEPGTYRELLISVSAPGLPAVTRRLVIENDDALVVYRGQAMVREVGQGEPGRRKVSFFVIVSGEVAQLAILGVVEYWRAEGGKFASLPDLAGGVSDASGLVAGAGLFLAEGPGSANRSLWQVSSPVAQRPERQSFAGQYLAYETVPVPGLLAAGPMVLRPDAALTRRARAEHLNSDQVMARILAGPLAGYTLR